MQIATKLAQVARVTLATREPVRFVNQRPYGRDIHFWWWLTRLDTRPLDSRLGTWLSRLADGKGPRVLDTEGQALQQHGVSLTVPGLSFVGLSNQRTFASATLRGVGPDAAVVVRHLTRHLAPATRAFSPARLRLAATEVCCPTR